MGLYATALYVVAKLGPPSPCLLATPLPLPWPPLLQIEEVVHSIEEKLAELNAERAELEAYQQLDRQQRGIEYALLDRELTAARKELAKVSGCSDDVLLSCCGVYSAWALLPGKKLY